jgi:hypothetical protein
MIFGSPADTVWFWTADTCIVWIDCTPNNCVFFVSIFCDIGPLRFLQISRISLYNNWADT